MKKFFVGGVVMVVASLIGSLAFAAQNMEYQPLNFTKPGYDYGPSVLWDDATSKWVMYHCGYNAGTNSDGVFRSDSSDGLTWSTPQVVLTIGTAGTWDSAHICDPTVLKDVNIVDGDTAYTWAMWYTGVTSGATNKVGLALSTDGVTWVRHSANPIIDCVTTDAEAWGCGQPSVVYASNTYYMNLAWLPCNPDTVSCRMNQVRTSTNGIDWSTVAGDYALPQAAVGPDFMLGLDGKWYSTIIGNLGCGQFSSNPQLASEFIVHRSDAMLAGSPTQIGCLAYTDTDGRMVAEQGFYRDRWGHQASNVPLGSVRVAFGLAQDGLFHNETEEIEAAKLFLSPVTAPVISSVTASRVTKTNAVIRWNTDVAATGEVRYRRAGAAFDANWVTASGDGTTKHQLQLTGLLPRTTYEYQVRSASSAGTATSSVYSFTTKR